MIVNASWSFKVVQGHRHLHKSKTTTLVVSCFLFIKALIKKTAVTVLIVESKQDRSGQQHHIWSRIIAVESIRATLFIISVVYELASRDYVINIGWCLTAYIRYNLVPRLMPWCSRSAIHIHTWPLASTHSFKNNRTRPYSFSRWTTVSYIYFRPNWGPTANPR